MMIVWLRWHQSSHGWAIFDVARSLVPGLWGTGAWWQCRMRRRWSEGWIAWSFGCLAELSFICFIPLAGYRGSTMVNLLLIGWVWCRELSSIRSPGCVSRTSAGVLCQSAVQVSRVLPRLSKVLFGCWSRPGCGRELREGCCWQWFLRYCWSAPMFNHKPRISFFQFLPI